MNRTTLIFATLLLSVMLAPPKRDQADPEMERPPENRALDLSHEINQATRRIFPGNSEAGSFQTLAVFDYRKPIKIVEGTIVRARPEQLLPFPSTTENFSEFLLRLPFDEKFARFARLRTFGCVQKFNETVIDISIHFSDPFVLPGAYAFMKVFELTRDIISNINSPTPDPINAEIGEIIHNLHTHTEEGAWMPNGLDVLLATDIQPENPTAVGCAILPRSGRGYDRFAITLSIHNTNELAFLSGFFSGSSESFFANTWLDPIFNPQQ